MDRTEMQKALPQIMVEIIDYIPKSVVIKTVLKKLTGNITVSSLDM